MPKHPGTWRGKRPRKRQEGIDLMAEQERARKRLARISTRPKLPLPSSEELEQAIDDALGPDLAKILRRTP